MIMKKEDFTMKRIPIRHISYFLILALILSAGSIAVFAEEPITLYVLSGPTGVGAMNLWSKADAGETEGSYRVIMTGANDEIVAAISNGDADIAAIATNMASTLYNKTKGQVIVLAVNTLGVLSLLSSGEEEIASVADLRGRTIYATGQGANPEYILRYVLSGNGLDPDSDVNIRFVAEGSELLTVWASDPSAILMAPQPVATTILMQNEGSGKIFDMTEEWDKISHGDSTLMMGCVIARKDFVEKNSAAVDLFLREYAASIAEALRNVEDTAVLCEQYGLIPKAALAAKAIPQCGLTFVTGSELKEQLNGYLQIMLRANPKSIGGALPEEDFYYSEETQ